MKTFYSGFILFYSFLSLTGCASGPTLEEQVAAANAETARIYAICGELWDTDEDLDACYIRRTAPAYLANIPSEPERTSNTAAIIGAALLGGAQGYARGLQNQPAIGYHPKPYVAPEMDYTNPKTGQVIRTNGAPPMGFY